MLFEMNRSPQQFIFFFKAFLRDIFNSNDYNHPGNDPYMVYIHVADKTRKKKKKENLLSTQPYSNITLNKIWY